MAFGDTGGSVTELIITCRTEPSGGVAIGKGDAVMLSGAYTVTNVTDAEDPIFGEAMAAATENDVAIPVKVRGISLFPYSGTAPSVDGEQGVVASATDGSVKAPASGNGRGINVKVDATATVVHVLL